MQRDPREGFAGLILEGKPSRAVSASLCKIRSRSRIPNRHRQESNAFRVILFAGCTKIKLVNSVNGIFFAREAVLAREWVLSERASNTRLMSVEVLQ